MKKLLLICLMVPMVFGIPISKTTAQVADSPGADFLHRSAPHVSPHPGDTHRGGVTRSDILAEVFDLVDHFGVLGAEDGSASARLGGLIYGELINPDSLEPLSINFTPYYFSESSKYMQEDSLPLLAPGIFFDGVLDPRAQKFLVKVPDYARPVYVTLKLGKRTLFENYILFPQDSIKIGINLQDNLMVFGGPDAASFEIQYQLQRLRNHKEFEQPRKIVLGDPASLLDQEDYRQQWESHKKAFGARLEFESFDQESLDHLLGKIKHAEEGLAPYLAVLDLWEKQLPAEKLDLIRLEIYAGYYQPFLSILYRFYYSELPRILGDQDLVAVHPRIKDLLEGIPMEQFTEEARLVSSSWLDMEQDRLTLLALIADESFLQMLNKHYAGEVADRLAAGFLTQNLRSYSEPESMLGQYLSQMEHKPWKDKVLAMKAATVPGDPMIALALENLEGDKLAFAELISNPTLIYFYFSTCPHSAHYFKDMLFPLYKEQAAAMGFQLVAISVDSDTTLWHKQLPVYSDPSIPNYRMLPYAKEKWKEYYEISGYPRTFLLDQNGMIKSFGLSRKSYVEFQSDFHRIAAELDLDHQTFQTN